LNDPILGERCQIYGEKAKRPLGRGSTAKEGLSTTMPRNLREQIALKAAIVNAQKGTRKLPLKRHRPKLEFSGISPSGDFHEEITIH
jgi:hypothetical protein